MHIVVWCSRSSMTTAATKELIMVEGTVIFEIFLPRLIYKSQKVGGRPKMEAVIFYITLRGFTVFGMHLSWSCSLVVGGSRG